MQWLVVLLAKTQINLNVQKQKQKFYEQTLAMLNFEDDDRKLTATFLYHEITKTVQTEYVQRVVGQKVQFSIRFQFRCEPNKGCDRARVIPMKLSQIYFVASTTCCQILSAFE